METGFACCKLKEFNNYCRVYCIGVFHPSCVARKSGFTVIDGHKILCSKECAKNFKDKTNASTLEPAKSSADQDQISKLSSECEKLRRRLVKEKDECNVKLEESKTEHFRLHSEISKELLEVKEKNVIAVAELKKCRVDLVNTKKDLDELTLLREKLLVSIDTLSVQNEQHLDEIKKLKNELCNTNNKKNPENFFKSTNIRQRKPQVLLFGNRSCVSGLGWLVKSFSGSRYDTNCQYPSNMQSTQNLVSKYGPLCEKFTKDDYVIVLPGLVNVRHGITIDEECWSSLYDISTRTNLIIVTPPYCNYGKTLNSSIYELNLDIQKHAYQNGMVYSIINSDHFMSPFERNFDGTMGYELKSRVSRFICAEYLSADLGKQRPNFLQDNNHSLVR